MSGGGLHGGDDEEDEETLQLKLQEIQARLRLKKLQNARNKDKSSNGSRPFLHTPSGVTESRKQCASGANGFAPTPPHSNVEVPASPNRKAQTAPQPESPSRVRLGIDKGLKAKDVSLKRAPGQRSTRELLPISRSANVGATSHHLSTRDGPPKPASFNERLALSRTEEANDRLRQERIRRARTNAFGIGQDDMERYKKTAVEIPDEPLQKPRAYSREEILAKGKPSTGHLVRSRTQPSLSSQPPRMSQDEPTSSEAPTESQEGEKEPASFETYSCFHLSRRNLPHRVLARHMSGTKLMSIQDLLRHVKSPDYSLPDLEQDIVVFGILAKKSEPRGHKPSTTKDGSQAEDRGKYMVMTLTDLTYEVELFLFNSGFTRFWKLTEGTVVAILNPTTMPPPVGRKDTGRFSLVINSDADTILEIGMARDMGFCKSIKKDGAPCGSWVNSKRTQFCEYHSNEAVRKQRAGRVEVNSSGFGGWAGRNKGPTKKKKKKKKEKEWEDWSKTDYNDREEPGKWFASRTFTPAELIDGKDRGMVDRKDRKEFLQRSVEAKEREHEMVRRLGQVGSAAGKEYMQHVGQRASNKSGTKPGEGAGAAASQQVAGSTGSGIVPASSAGVGAGNEPIKLDAASLGLQRSKGQKIELGSVKRKRGEGSRGSSISMAASTAAGGGLGWGGNLRDKLSKMKEGESLRGSGPLSPVRKKTRFVTAKGIREAGRDSLGVDLQGGQGLDVVGGDDDDDDLIIV